MGAVESFYEKSRLIHDIQEVQQLVEWDQQVLLPAEGGIQRSNQIAALASIGHEKMTDPRLGEIIEELAARNDLDEHTAADVREAKRNYDKAVKIPKEIIAERAKACSMAQSAWERARPKNDFAAFAPHLEKVVKLTLQMAQAIEPEKPYDALLDEFEPGMSEKELRELFPRLKPKIVALLDKIKGASHKPDRSILTRHYPADAQKDFCLRIAGEIGFDMSAGRMDTSAHPFTSGTMRDVRLTTRYDERFISSALFGTLHEAGHGIYEQGLNPDRFRDPAGQGCSLGIHESQSRFWENIIGRSQAFWDRYFPLLQESFPSALDGVDAAAFCGAVNAVTPSLIRVEADEVTYNLHIILRFEIESGLFSGEFSVKDLPEIWNVKMHESLGITPPSDRDGVMQDIHWSAGLIGYFPTYTLGNLYGPQFVEAMRRDIPDLDGEVSRGRFAPIREWLMEKIHRHGRLYLAQELCQRVTGSPLSEDAAMRYLEGKFSAIYGF